MSLENLLIKIRKLNKIFQNSNTDIILFNDICRLLSEILSSNVTIISKKGKILGYYPNYNKLFPDIKLGNYLNETIIEELNIINETKENLNISNFYTNSLNISSSDVNNYNISVIPINYAGLRKATLLLYKFEEIYSIQDIIIGEYGATIISLEILRSENEENTEILRKNSIVKSAIGTLSYSELEAILHIFDELNGKEGLIIASKVADKVGITRSVIVNALRKFESAGLIESRSLGMKGTYIKVLNDVLIGELNKLRG